MNRWPTVARCLLVMAVWQGPVPVVHSHGTLAHASVESTSWLAEHLTTDHADVPPSEDVVFGWHVHLEMPGSHDDSSESSAAPRPAQIVEASPITGWTVSLRNHAPLSSWVPVPSMTMADRLSSAVAEGSRRPRGGFFATFAPAMPLPVRLGVLRC